ncbi:TAFII55 protein conserved region-domain-containing protein [Chytriomyces cf. hyalinus JEL632]|nr:TAFII55 protein conserved region-domain-containing protein [Chytriomyces cf. hyalinus JEL632]
MSNAPNGKVKLKRESDKSTEVLPPVEEQLILRVGDPQLAATLKQIVKDREALDDLSLVFNDPRKGALRWKDALYPLTLVDLPCIIESHKTWDNRQLYKIADISQMLVVESKNSSHAYVPREKADEFVWPHGISAPLLHVRKRRFRKRISKRAIENVEREVERLLQADEEAEDVTYEEVIETQDEVGNAENNGEDGQDEERVVDDEGFDSDDLVAAIEDELDEDGNEDGGDDEEMEEEDDDEALEEEEKPAGGASDDEGSDDEDEGEDEEMRELKEEIAELEETIAEKHQNLQEQTNPIMRNRFEMIVRKLNEELSKKKAALAALFPS